LQLNSAARRECGGGEARRGRGTRPGWLASFRLNRILSHRRQTSLIDIICRCSMLAPCQPAWQPANLAQCSPYQPISGQQAASRSTNGWVSFADEYLSMSISERCGSAFTESEKIATSFSPHHPRCVFLTHGCSTVITLRVEITAKLCRRAAVESSTRGRELQSRNAQLLKRRSRRRMGSCRWSVGLIAALKKECSWTDVAVCDPFVDSDVHLFCCS